jgi:hypothetical protein
MCGFQVNGRRMALWEKTFINVENKASALLHTNLKN